VSSSASTSSEPAVSEGKRGEFGWGLPALNVTAGALQSVLHREGITPVDRLLAKEASNCDDGCTFRWIVEDGEVLGGIALRHEPTQGAEALGHVGYGLRPSARGRGLAAAALREMLYLAKARNMDRVVLACFVDNVPSVKTIERCGGVLNRIVTTDRGEVGRYTIRLS
jgi:predicted acetyltransferase